MAQHFKDLVVWQKAMDLVNAIYDATEGFPKREVYS
jgi:23S rRNA-intervening sequence protein